MVQQPPPTLPQRDMFPETIVTPFPAQSAPKQAPQFRIEPEPVLAQDDVSPALLEMAQAIANIVSTRALLFLVILTSSAIWIWTIVDPVHDRIYAATAFSIVTLWPITLLYYKQKG